MRGDPSTYSRILRFLVFGSSRSFKHFLAEKEVDKGMEFLPDLKFIK